MPTKYRNEKVSALVRDEIGAILLHELDLTVDALVTVTRAVLSEDGAHVRVFVSVLPENLAEIVLKEITKNIYNYQQLLNKQLRIRPVPKMYFVVDDTEAEASKIEKLIDSVEIIPAEEEKTEE